MSLIPWRKKEQQPESSSALTPRDRFSTLREDMDQLFQRFARGFGELTSIWPHETATGWMPSLDVNETETEITVRAELPGVDPKDVDVSLSGNQLTLRGQKSEEKEDRDRDHYYAERRYGSFSRTIQLPTSVDPDKITAEAANGVLTIRLHKDQAQAPKRIDVKMK